MKPAPSRRAHPRKRPRTERVVHLADLDKITDAIARRINHLEGEGLRWLKGNEKRIVSLERELARLKSQRIEESLPKE